MNLPPHEIKCCNKKFFAFTIVHEKTRYTVKVGMCGRSLFTNLLILICDFDYCSCQLVYSETS